jgi:hypothetical protein
MSKSTRGKSTKTAAPATERKEEPKPSLLPNDILHAITEARKRNPKDKHGDTAFRIDKARMKAFQNKTDKKRKAIYIPFQVQHRGDWVGINLRVMNVKTTAGVRAPEEREYGLDLTFRQSSSFSRKDRKTGKEVVEHYGEAVVACYEAFQRICDRMVAAEELTGKKTDALTKVQYDADGRDEKGVKTGKKEKLEDPIFRVGLRMTQDEAEFTDLKDDIRDVRRKLKKVPKGEIMPYDLALDGPEEDADSKPLTPLTCHEFFRNKTPVFGVHCMDQVCISNQGISVPGTFSLLAAKKPRGSRPAFEAHFDAAEVAEWADADAFADSEDGSGEGEPDETDGAEAAEGDYDDVLDAVEDAATEEEAADDADEAVADDAEPDEDELDALEEEVAEPVKKTVKKKGGKK